MQNKGSQEKEKKRERKILRKRTLPFKNLQGNKHWGELKKRECEDHNRRMVEGGDDEDNQPMEYIYRLI